MVGITSNSLKYVAAGRGRQDSLRDFAKLVFAVNHHRVRQEQVASTEHQNESQ